MPSVRVFSDPRMVAHDPGGFHPERPDRLRALLDSLASDPVAGVRVESAAPATREQAERVHGATYVALLEGCRGESVHLDPDTATSPESVDAAWLAAGCAIAAAEAALGGDRAFALVRPPGHHAERSRAMGFCLLNNIAIAAAVALERVGRVLIVDWDVHHGNGTQHLFEARREVLFYSSHQADFYPGTGRRSERGRGEGEGYTLNAPLPAGSGDEEVLAAFDELLVPAARSFDPELVLVSAGFDGHLDDPLAGHRMSARGYAELTRRVLALGAPTALVLEGGYELDALTRSVRACLEVLAEA